MSVFHKLAMLFKKRSWILKTQSPTRFPLRHIALGLAIRELLAPWTGHPYDFEIWTRLGFYMQNLASPYTHLHYVPGLSFAPWPTTGSIGYPPLSAFIFALTYRSYVLLGEPSRFLYYFLLKQPMILADVGIAVALAKIILLTGETKSARTAFLVWLYFPLGIIISSMWGQLDSVALLLALLATYYFMSNKWLASALLFGLSIYLKALPVVFLPVFLIQSGVAWASRVRHFVVSLAIPFAGTLVPALVFNWSFQGIYNYFEFQAVTPYAGEMSIVRLFYSLPSLSGIASDFTPYLWVPVLLGGYVYIRKRNVGLLHGLLFASLAFSLWRPFLSEQWSIYPLAFLLLRRNKENLGHFLGLTVASTVFVVASKTFLVAFFSPVFPGLSGWGLFEWNFLTIGQQPFVALRSAVMSLSAVVYFAESFLVLLGRESIVYRAITLAPYWTLHRLKVSPPGVGPA